MRPGVFVWLAVQALGWLPSAVQAEESAGAPVPAVPDALAANRRALREFDRFLDHNPLLEDQLLHKPQLITNHVFLEKTPELKAFLLANPNVVEGLKTYPRYFLNRALLRQASAPLAFADLAPLKELFQQQPELQEQLIQAPERIRDPRFLESHPALRDVLVQHPTLAGAFLPIPASSEK